MVSRGGFGDGSQGGKLSAKSRQLSVSFSVSYLSQADLRIVESNVEIAVSIDLWKGDNQVVLRQVVDAQRIDGIIIWAKRDGGSRELESRVQDIDRLVRHYGQGGPGEAK
jgi:hypothetical protein